MPYIGKKPADIIATAVDTTTGTFSGDLTVDTSTLYVDSANNRVGVGTVSPANKLHVYGGHLEIESASTDAVLYFDNSGNTGTLSITGSNNDMLFKTSGSERMRIDSSGNVGIGTTNPATFSLIPANRLVVGTGSSDEGITIYSSTSTAGTLAFADGTSGDAEYRGFVQYHHNGDYMRFFTAATESMRIDSSGNLLVGTTNANPAESNVAGIGLLAGNAISVTDDGGAPIQLNRKTSDGSIAIFRKDGSTVGSIGAEGGQLYIVTGDTGLKFAPGVDSVIPVNANGANRDGAIDIGVSSVRFKDLYLSGSIANPSGNLTLDASGDIILDADGEDIRLKNGGTEWGKLSDPNGDFGIQAIAQDKDIVFYGNDGGSVTEAMRIDISAGGNVLIGTTDNNPAINDIIGTAIRNDGEMEISASGKVLDINSQSFGNMIVFRNDGTAVGNIGVNTKLYISSSGETYTTGVSFQGSGTSTNRNIAPSDASGVLVDGAINLGSSSARWNSLWLSGGVYLGGTGSANYLDDYEEGTWTPSMGGTTTYYNRTGVYTKVGNKVFIRGQVHINAIGTGDTHKILGLPFTSESTSNGNPAGVLGVSYYSGLAIAVTYISGYVESAQSRIQISANATAHSTVQYNTGAFFGNNTRLDFSMTYRV